MSEPGKSDKSDEAKTASPSGEAPRWTAEATEKLMHALNRADEIGGELRDYIKDKMATDPRYIQWRKTWAKLTGREFVSQDEQVAAAAKVAEQKAAAAATTAVKAQPRGFGDPGIAAQIYGRASCPWTGRARSLMEKHKVDFDWIDLEQPEHEAKATPLAVETGQTTVPYVYLRGQFVGGFNALSEVERLGQLEAALMTPEQRAALPAHQQKVEIVARPNTDEVAPAEE